MKPEQCPHCRAPESYLEKIGRVWVCQCCSKVVGDNLGPKMAGFEPAWGAAWCQCPSPELGPPISRLTPKPLGYTRGPR
jgi:hypothetical protein